MVECVLLLQSPSQSNSWVCVNIVVPLAFMLDTKLRKLNWTHDVGNKEEIIPEFSLKITQFDFTKRGGKDEAWIKSLS